MLDPKYDRDSRSSIDGFLALVKKIDQNLNHISDEFQKTELARAISAFPDMAERITTAILGPNAESLKMFAGRHRPSRNYGTMDRSHQADIVAIRRSYEERLQAKDETIQELKAEVEHLNDLLTIPEIEERSG